MALSAELSHPQGIPVLAWPGLLPSSTSSQNVNIPLTLVLCFSLSSLLTLCSVTCSSGLPCSASAFLLHQHLSYDISSALFAILSQVACRQEYYWTSEYVQVSSVVNYITEHKNNLGTRFAGPSTRPLLYVFTTIHHAV